MRFHLTLVTLTLTALLFVGCASKQKSSTAAGSTPQAANNTPPLRDVKHIMRSKLVYAQAALEGIALDNTDKVKSAADELTKLSTDSQFKVHATVTYDLFSAEFRAHTEAMAAQATKKNVEGMALEYVQMTMTCVRCHSYLRSEGLAGPEIDDAMRALLARAPQP